MIRSIKTVLITMLALVALMATPFMAAADEPTEIIRTISTSGEGVVKVEPDAASFSVGIEARNEELELAQEEATNETNAIMEMLRGEGLEDKDIVTSGYQVEPVEKRDRNGNFVEIESYVVRVAITITVNDIEAVGGLLDQTVSLGADYVSRINFFVSDPDPYIQEARKLAIADARQKAEDYALGSNSDLTGLYTLYESSSPSPTARDSGAPEPAAEPMRADMSEAEKVNPVEVSAGSTTITVRVDTTWTIEPSDSAQPEATPAN